MNGMDWLMLVWAVWLAISSLFHRNQAEALVFRMGLIYDACGIYFLIRVFCRSLYDVARVCRIAGIVLVPVALEMLYERVTIHNLFYDAVGSQITLYIRNDKVRAQGPFAHAILAGTVGAVCLPLVVAIWSQNRRDAAIGIGASLVMIITCASSGPILSLMAAIGGLFMWRYRDRVRVACWLAVLAYIALGLVMKEPAYYIMARLDLTGGSTGWHRARLIESALEHLDEWWLGGTDFTRHWMASGVSWSADHTDITNQYIKMGVIGGLPSMLLFMALLAKGFSFVGWTLRQMLDQSPQSKFLVWALGASLFAHSTVFIAVSYFDQSSFFIYMTLALIGSSWSGTAS